MQVLRAFEIEEVKVATKESKAIALCKDALLAIKTLNAEFVCIKKHCRTHEMTL